MVRFSQSIDNNQRADRRKQSTQNVVNEDYYMYEERPHERYEPEPRKVYVENTNQRPVNREIPKGLPNDIPKEVYARPNEPQGYYDIDYEIPQKESSFEIPEIQKELQFLPEDNIKFGVKYSKNSRPPVIGKNHTIRSNSIIYNDVVIGDNFRTGHNVVIRENTNIGDDVLIGTNTVIEGDVIIGNDVSIQSNVYIPTNSVIEDNVFIGPCACFTNDKYPVRINYELQGPKVRRGASIGGNTTFLSNVEIGEGSIVAAGAIVIHSVPPFYLAIGTPARIKPLPDHLKVPNRF